MKICAKACSDDLENFKLLKVPVTLPSGTFFSFYPYIKTPDFYFDKSSLCGPIPACNPSFSAGYGFSRERSPATSSRPLSSQAFARSS